MKIELFSNLDMARCQNQVNQFLAECEQKGHQVQDVKFMASPSADGEESLFSVMVILSNVSLDLKKKPAILEKE